MALQEMSLRDVIEAKEGKDSGVSLTVYPNVNRCFEALTTGEADAIYCDSVTANYFMRIHHASEYVVNTKGAYPCNLAMGISRNADPRLISILDKCIRFISIEDMDGLVMHNGMPKVNSIENILDQLPRRYIVGIILVLAALVLFMTCSCVLLWHKRKIDQKLAAVREKNHQIQVDLAAEKRINEAKEEFFSHISHDMRTPLNGIVGFTRLAAQAVTLDKAREYIEKIRLSGKVLLDLINDTLQFSKLEQGKFLLSPQPIDKAELVREVATPIRMIAEERQVRFFVDMSHMKEERVLADVLNTQKIFLNILSNAVKFTPPGGTVSLTVESIPTEPDGINTKVIVRDTGLGISEEFLPRIYEPFSQECRAGTTLLAGSGLGLSIVRQLVDLMQGRITIRSRRGEGTEVTVWLSFPPAPAELNATVGKETADDRSPFQGKKILLCEDNALNTEIARTLLEQQGITVICAANGKEGLELFSASPVGDIDLILMDLRMPVMDGYEAVRRLRSLRRDDAKAVPIVAMTADAYERDIRQCLDVGMNAHMAKPVDMGVLMKILERYLSV